MFLLLFHGGYSLSAVAALPPADKLAGRAEAILTARDAKLAAAREARKARRQRERIPA